MHMITSVHAAYATVNQTAFPGCGWQPPARKHYWRKAPCFPKRLERAFHAHVWDAHRTRHGLLRQLVCQVSGVRLFLPQTETECLEVGLPAPD